MLHTPADFTAVKSAQGTREQEDPFFCWSNFINTRTGKEETRACCGGIRGETEDGSSRGGRTFPREPEIHILRDGRLLILPKKAAGPARSSVSRFSGSAGPASARCPRASAGRLGPAAIQTEPTNKGLAAGGAGPPSGTGAGSPAVPRPTAVPPWGFSFLAFGAQASPGGAGPSPRATRARPTAGGGPRTARAQGCKPLRRAGLSACETRVKLSRPLQASPLTRRPRADGRGRPSNARRSGPAWPRWSCGLKAAAPPPARRAPSWVESRAGAGDPAASHPYPHSQVPRGRLLWWFTPWLFSPNAGSSQPSGCGGAAPN
ncbi:translation initiation factor IF-2-like [Cervus elaphus]|uniref:translation initiation factor IF-2-like n=1 Tax=Cervus elaphus TaxID=9860 RepID=UPI001CC29260|nr:translation initiation factor IF-2-like [Cervus elaphus]